MTTLILASRSPRRRRLLGDAGVAHRAQPAGIDDGELPHSGADPLHWVAALAYLKAADVARREPESPVLAADTLVIKDRRIIGKPDSTDHAREIIASLAAGSHTVATGVALLVPGRPRLLFTDAAAVEVGPLTPGEIDAYLASGAFEGKAGAYNLEERQAAGWPLRCDGDPATVMGLPMRRLAPHLRPFTKAPTVS